MRRVVLVVALLAAAIGPRPAAAQEIPLVLVHGFSSGGDTWLDAAVRLNSQLMVSVQRPSINWRNTYASQAQELRTAFGSYPGSTILLGHSNGGVVARQFASHRPFGGLVTLSTPNRGAPLANHAYHWIGMNLEAFGLIARVTGAFADQYSGSAWVLGVINGALQLSESWARDSLTGLGRLGIDARYEVFNEAPFGSAFFQNLNSDARLNTEINNVPNRVAIVNTVSNPGAGGIFRAIFPEQADAINTSLWVAATTLDVWGLQIVNSGATVDIERANAMWTLSAWLKNHERFWCNTISDPTAYAYTPLGVCLDNDTVIPNWTAEMPRGLSIRKANAPPHIRQTRDMNAVLYEVLTTQMRVPPRGAGGGTGSPTVLTMGQVIFPNQELRSPDGRYRLVYQPDGNLVIYRYDGAAAWSSGTVGQPPGVVAMQGDGNLVIYNSPGQAVWHTGTYGNPGAYLTLNNSGTIAMLSAAGATLWSSPQPPWNVAPPAPDPTGPSTLMPGTRLYPGQAVSSTNGRFALTYQSDGNLVLYGAGGVPRWSTQVFSAPGYAEMQVDGNFVVYASDGTPRWASNTSGYLNARLTIRDDGNIVITTAGGAALWQSGTGGS